MTIPTPTTSPAGWPDHDADQDTIDIDEAFIDIPITLIAHAAELLELCDHLIGRRRIPCIDTQLGELLHQRGITNPTTTRTRLRTGLGQTHRQLTAYLDDAGIWIEPSLLPPPTCRLIP